MYSQNAESTFVFCWGTHQTWNVQIHLTHPILNISNGMIEKMVQRVEKCLREYMAVGHNPYLTMLTYRGTPSSSSLLAPAELLDGRRYRALLPTRSLMQNAHRHIVREPVGWWQGNKCWTLQQISKRTTTPTYAAEGLCSNQSEAEPVDFS